MCMGFVLSDFGLILIQYFLTTPSLLPFAMRMYIFCAIICLEYVICFDFVRGYSEEIALSFRRDFGHLKRRL